MSTRYLPVFVYGTLQPGSRGYGAYLKPAVIERAPAYWAEASLYIGPAYPMAIRSIGGTGVWGTIMLMDQRTFADALGEMDDYEGYRGEGDPDNLYTRQTVEVEVYPDAESTWEGPTQKVTAYAYIATRLAFRQNRGQLLLSPSGDWANHQDEWDELSTQVEAEEERFRDDRFDED